MHHKKQIKIDFHRQCEFIVRKYGLIVKLNIEVGVDAAGIRSPGHTKGLL